MKITVLGAGTMGIQLSVLFASKGFDVILWNYRNKEALPNSIKRVIVIQSKLGFIERKDIDKILKKIVINNNLRKASNSCVIIEAITERLEFKRDLIYKLNIFSKKDTVLITNTSSLSVTEIASFYKFPKMVVGMHFFNPPFTCSFVEIIRGRYTSDFPLNLSITIAKKTCTSHVIIDDSPGFIVNRILFPMINEAVLLLSESELNPKEIDEAYKKGTGNMLGPLELADFIGLDICVNILNSLKRQTGDKKYLPAPLLIKLVKEGRLGRKVRKGIY
jgi:3-hydroxybutyryl-CoA dehydrogenase